MTLKRYNKLRREWKQFKFPRFGELDGPAQRALLKSSAQRALTLRAAGFLSGVEHRMFREKAKFTTAEFHQFLVDQTPIFDAAILKDIRATDGWLTNVSTRTSPVGTPVDVTVDRFKDVWSKVQRRRSKLKSPNAWIPTAAGF